MASFRNINSAQPEGKRLNTAYGQEKMILNPDEPLDQPENQILKTSASQKSKKEVKSLTNTKNATLEDLKLHQDPPKLINLIEI